MHMFPYTVPPVCVRHPILSATLSKLNGSKRSPGNFPFFRYFLFCFTAMDVNMCKPSEND